MLIGENVECLFCTGYKHADKHRWWIDEQRLYRDSHKLCLFNVFSKLHCIYALHVMFQTKIEWIHVNIII